MVFTARCSRDIDVRFRIVNEDNEITLIHDKIYICNTLVLMISFAHRIVGNMYNE